MFIDSRRGTVYKFWLTFNDYVNTSIFDTKDCNPKALSIFQRLSFIENFIKSIDKGQFFFASCGTVIIFGGWHGIWYVKQVCM